jgi:hypothetical protein
LRSPERVPLAYSNLEEYEWDESTEEAVFIYADDSLVRRHQPLRVTINDEQRADYFERASLYYRGLL